MSNFKKVIATAIIVSIFACFSTAVTAQETKTEDATEANIIEEAAKVNIPANFVDKEGIEIYLDGKIISFDEVPFIDENNRTLVPMRAIFEAYGCNVEWDEITQTVTATKGETVIKLTIGSKEMFIDNRRVELDTTAQLVNDARTFVPVRAISEALNCEVDWVEKSETIVITSITEAAVEPVTDENAIVSEDPMISEIDELGPATNEFFSEEIIDEEYYEDEYYEDESYEDEYYEDEYYEDEYFEE